MKSTPGTEADAAEHDVDALFRAFCRPSLPAAPQDIVRFARLLEETKRFLDHRLRQLVTKAAHRPVLLSLACGGTPTSTTKKQTFGAPGVQSVCRAGRSTEEYLVQTVFSAFHDGSSLQRVAKLREPVPLTFGKSTDATFGCTLDFQQTLSTLGHVGVGIHHYAFDRALWSSMTTLYRKLHVEQARTSEDAMSPIPKHIRFLLTWVVSTPCACHDAHTGQEWSLASMVRGTDTMKRVFIAVESVRNSYSQILRFLPALIAQMQIVPIGECVAEQHLLDLWAALGVEGSLSRALARARLIVIGGRLQVCGDIMPLSQLGQQVSYLLPALWRFTRFSESRWVSVGAASRRIACGMLSGLDRIVE